MASVTANRVLPWLPILMLFCHSTQGRLQGKYKKLFTQLHFINLSGFVAVKCEDFMAFYQVKSYPLEMFIFGISIRSLPSRILRFGLKRSFNSSMNSNDSFLDFLKL